MNRMSLGCRRAAWYCWPLITLALSIGCANRSQYMPLDATAGLYDRATLEYRLDAGRLNSPLAVARIEGQLVSYDQLASPQLADQCVGTLKIQYPHPEGHASAALVTLEVVAQANRAPVAAAPSWWQRWLPGNSSLTAEPAASEVWQLDISKGELDTLVARLQGQGFFDAAAPSGSGVQLSLNLNSGRVSKTWTPVTELDALMLRARSQGQLVNYTRNARATTALLDTATPANAFVEALTNTPPAPRQGSLSWGAAPSLPAVTQASAVDPFLATAAQNPPVMAAAGAYPLAPPAVSASAAPTLPADGGAYPASPAPPLMADAPQVRPAYR